MAPAALALLCLPLAARAVSLSRQATGALAGDPLPRGSRGEEPWPLFPEGRVPGHQLRDVGQEAYYRAEASNAVGMMCSPSGRAAANYYYRVSRPTLVPYLVDRQDPLWKDAAVVISPGGGNDHLAFDVTGIDMAKWLNSLGVSAFVLKYRVPTNAWAEDNSVKLMDGQRAISLVRSNASALGLDPQKVGLMGASAGGELAIHVATAAKRSYSAVDAVDEQPFAPDFLLLLYPGITPGLFAGAGRMPPTFIQMAVDDPCVDVNGVVTFFQAMRQAGAPTSELHIAPSGRHGWGTCQRYPGWEVHEVCGWPGRAELFLSGLAQKQAAGSNTVLVGDRSPVAWCPPKGLMPCRNPARCVGNCTDACWATCP